jgi:hypothetical protein
MLKFFKELPDKYLSVFVLFVLLVFYTRFQTTFFEQAILFILGVVGGMLRGVTTPPPPSAVTTGNVENQIVTTPDPAVTEAKGEK